MFVWADNGLTFELKKTTNKSSLVNFCIGSGIRLDNLAKNRCRLSTHFVNYRKHTNKTVWHLYDIVKSEFIFKNTYLFTTLDREKKQITAKKIVMETSNNVRLRLRFYKDVEEEINLVRNKFEDYAQKLSGEFKIVVCDDHIWMNVIGEKRQYWSPHLHLELESKENHTHIRALFGPSQTLWTFFMFLHFLVAGVFIIFGMILYSNLTLKQPFIMDLLVMGLMVIVWFLLYFIARQIRSNGYGQMDELEALFLKILE